MSTGEVMFSKAVSSCGDPAAGESLKHILKAVSALFQNSLQRHHWTLRLRLYFHAELDSVCTISCTGSNLPNQTPNLVHYHDGCLSRDQGISPSLKLSCPSSFLYLQLAWNNLSSWLPFKDWSDQKYSNCLKNRMSLGTKIWSSTSCSHLVWKQVILKNFNCSSLSEVSKKSWRDGKGGSPVKEERDAKQKYFHSSPVRNRLTTISRILTGRESVCKVFLNNILFHLQDCCGWILSSRVQWKCFK